MNKKLLWFIIPCFVSILFAIEAYFHYKGMRVSAPFFNKDNNDTIIEVDAIITGATFTFVVVSFASRGSESKLESIESSLYWETRTLIRVSDKKKKWSASNLVFAFLSPAIIVVTSILLTMIELFASFCDLSITPLICEFFTVLLAFGALARYWSFRKYWFFYILQSLAENNLETKQMFKKINEKDLIDTIFLYKIEEIYKEVLADESQEKNKIDNLLKKNFNSDDENLEKHVKVESQKVDDDNNDMAKHGFVGLETYQIKNKNTKGEENE